MGHADGEETSKNENLKLIFKIMKDQTSKLHRFAVLQKSGKAPRLSSINIYFPCCNELYFSTACSQILKDQLIPRLRKYAMLRERGGGNPKPGNFQKLPPFLKVTQILRILLE